MTNPLYFLFDVDDTLTKPKTLIDDEMINLIEKLSKYGVISVVGGGTYSHISSQLKPINHIVQYIFSENGTVTYLNNKHVASKRISDVVEEKFMNSLISFLLKYISKIDLPIKRGTFIEFRNGLINISPIGRNCTLEERDIFSSYDKEHKILAAFKAEIENKLEGSPLTVSYGGKISLDIYPKEWNKSYCLQFLDTKENNIIFFGDKIYEGGNDYELAIDKRLHKYIKVKNNEDCKQIIRQMIESYETGK